MSLFSKTATLLLPFLNIAVLAKLSQPPRKRKLTERELTFPVARVSRLDICSEVLLILIFVKFYHLSPIVYIGTKLARLRTTKKCLQ